MKAIEARLARGDATQELGDRVMVVRPTTSCRTSRPTTSRGLAAPNRRSAAAFMARIDAVAGDDRDAGRHGLDNLPQPLLPGLRLRSAALVSSSR